jgi:hypothetical protein
MRLYIIVATHAASNLQVVVSQCPCWRCRCCYCSSSGARYSSKQVASVHACCCRCWAVVATALLDGGVCCEG